MKVLPFSDFLYYVCVSWIVCVYIYFCDTKMNVMLPMPHSISWLHLIICTEIKQCSSIDATPIYKNSNCSSSSLFCIFDLCPGSVIFIFSFLRKLNFSFLLLLCRLPRTWARILNEYSLHIFLLLAHSPSFSRAFFNHSLKSW